MVSLPYKISISEFTYLIDNYSQIFVPHIFFHSKRVALLSKLIAQEMKLSEKDVDKVFLAGLLHDIGKIKIAQDYLVKPGKLDKDEMIQVQAHPVIGYHILKKVPALEDIAMAVLHHHERNDGMGYPDGLSCNEIPLVSRIIAVADSFDAISCDRPYRSSRGYMNAFEEIKEHDKDQFCPEVSNYLDKLRKTIPEKLKKIGKEKFSHIGRVKHEDLMHSKKIDFIIQKIENYTKISS